MVVRMTDDHLIFSPEDRDFVLMANDKTYVEFFQFRNNLLVYGTKEQMYKFLEELSNIVDVVLR